MHITATLAVRLERVEELVKRPGTRGEGRAAEAAAARLYGARLPEPPYKAGELVYAGTRYPPCKCGSMLFKIEPGTGPHAAKLVCGKCGKFSKWLRQAIVAVGGTSC